MSRLLYLYGLTAEDVKAPAAAPCVDGRGSLDKKTIVGLAAWVSEVDDVEFGQKLASHIENLDWLAAHSVRHQDTVAAIAKQGSIIPARFGTVFVSEASLIDHVQRGSRDITQKLERISEADEWGVKVFRDAHNVPNPILASSGKDYLQQKAARRKQETGARSPELEEMIEELVHSSLASVPIGAVSGGQQHLEWQAAFLVKRSRKPAWDAILARYAQRLQPHHVIECTGPWPPYSFV